MGRKSKNEDGGAGVAAAVKLDHEGQRAVGVIVLGVVEGEIGVLQTIALFYWLFYNNVN